MNAENSVFAIDPRETQIEDAVDELVANGFATDHIVLHPKNKDAREFAARKGTRTAKGTDKGRYADIPLDGTLEFLHPVEGPLQGALHDALIEMGVPSESCDHRVVHGKFLISVRCKSRDEFFRATGILKFTGASDISWSVPPEEYTESDLFPFQPEPTNRQGRSCYPGMSSSRRRLRN
jgi:hypothetical protein